MYEIDGVNNKQCLISGNVKVFFPAEGIVSHALIDAAIGFLHYFAYNNFSILQCKHFLMYIVYSQ